MTEVRCMNNQKFLCYVRSQCQYWFALNNPSDRWYCAFLDAPELSQVYAYQTTALGRADILFANLELGFKQ